MALLAAAFTVLPTSAPRRAPVASATPARPTVELVEQIPVALAPATGIAISPRRSETDSREIHNLEIAGSTPAAATTEPPHIAAASSGDKTSPLETILPTPAIWSEQLSADQVRDLLRAAGSPEEWIEPLVAISECESHHSPGAIGDSGSSVGMFQLWRGWFASAGEDVAQYADPHVNARVALHVRRVRGRFGGPGGWSCARAGE